jgi:MFS transporter, DHA1 family, multidrug resistance protein
MDIVDNEIELAEVEADRYLSRRSWQDGDDGRSSVTRKTTTGSAAITTSQSHRRRTQRDLEHYQTVSRITSRIEMQRLQYTHTVGASKESRNRASREPWPAFGGGKPYPPPLPAREEYVVEFDGPDDLLHPQNWSLHRKYVDLASLSMSCIISKRLKTRHCRHSSIHKPLLDI